jgi:HK97 family phage portal protein
MIREWIRREIRDYRELFGTPEQRADLTPPMFLQDPALSEYVGGGATQSGVRISEITALNLSTVWCAVNVIASAVSTLPLILYHRLPNGGKERAVSHPLYRLLHDAWNPRMVSSVARETLMAHVLIWGNFYCEIVRDDTGQVRSLWPIAPERVTPEVSTSGRLTYKVHRPTGGDLRFTEEEILHVPGLAHDGLVGMSVISRAREELGLATSARDWGARFFRNSAQPNGVFTFQGRLSAEALARLQADWQAAHQGTAQSHRVALLEGGMTWQPLSIPNRDAEFMALREFEVIEVARWFNVPVYKLHDMRHSAVRANIEHSAIEFVQGTVTPWLVKIEQTINATLLGGTGSLFVEHLVDGLLRGDQASRYQAYWTGHQGGWLSVNEIRTRENLNPIEGGDEYLTPLNMAPAGSMRPPTSG